MEDRGDHAVAVRRRRQVEGHLRERRRGVPDRRRGAARHARPRRGLSSSSPGAARCPPPSTGARRGWVHQPPAAGVQSAAGAPARRGRVRRSALGRAKHDFAWATRVAAAAGRAFGYALIGYGLFELFFFRAFGGDWLAFSGWFLLDAAGAEARYLAARRALAGLRVCDLIVREPVSVHPDQTLGEFMDEAVWSRRHRTYPVGEHGRALGLLPFRSVATIARREWDARLVREAMVPRDPGSALRDRRRADRRTRRARRERALTWPRPRRRAAGRPALDYRRRARSRLAAAARRAERLS